MKKELYILTISSVVGVIVGLVSILIVWPDLILVSYAAVLSIFIIIGPVGAYDYLNRKNVGDWEKYFPSFLIQLSESKKAGLNLTQAIISSSKSNHGKLSKEIQKMSYQLSWGVSITRALKLFQERTRKSYYLNRSIAIILESYESGGDIASTMEAISNSINTLKEVENNRTSILQEQIVIIYSIHFIFVGIIIAMYKIMLPLLNIQTTGTGFLASSSQSLDVGYFKLLFFLTLLVQSVSNGLVAGEAKDNSLSAGLKHVAILFCVSIIGYTSFILPRELNLVVNFRDNQVQLGSEFYLSGTLQEEGISANNATILVILGNNRETARTDATGKYVIEITSPNKEGIYEIQIKAFHNGIETITNKEVFVKG